MQHKLTQMLATSLIPLWTLSCSSPLVQIGPAASQPAPVVNNIVASSCTWEAPYYPDKGFETRWTRAEKVWLVSHNRKVSDFCPTLRGSTQ